MQLYWMQIQPLCRQRLFIRQWERFSWSELNGSLIAGGTEVDKTARLIIRLSFGFVSDLILRRVRWPPESGCEKSRGRVESLLGHETGWKRLISPPTYINVDMESLRFTFFITKCLKTASQGGDQLSPAFTLTQIWGNCHKDLFRVK